MLYFNLCARTMKKIINALVVCFLLLVLLQPFFNSTAQAQNIFIVDDEGEGDYSSISAAIENSTSGDIIRVYSGTYEGKIEIMHSITLEGISSEYGFGDDVGKPILHTTEDVGSLVLIEADYCILTGFHILPGISEDNDFGNNGVALHSKENIVSHCTFSRGNRAILAYVGADTADCSGNKIHNNTIEDFTTAIHIEGENCSIKHNQIKNNTFGIHLFDCNNVKVEENNFKTNKIHAFVFWIPYSYNLYYPRPTNIQFDNNYYDNWPLSLPKPIIRGFAPLLIPITFGLLFDKNPRQDPLQFQ